MLRSVNLARAARFLGAASARRYSAVTTSTKEDVVSSPAEDAGELAQQAPNRVGTWSKTQADRQTAMTGPRFEQTDMSAQPRPMAAIELIAEEPVRMVSQRIVACDGGGGALGHPKVFINLDEGKPMSCHYCGIRFQKPDHHH